METYEEYDRQMAALHKKIRKFCDKHNISTYDDEHNINNYGIEDLYWIAIHAIELGRKLNGGDLIYEMGYTLAMNSVAWAMLDSGIDTKLVRRVTRFDTNDIEDTKKRVEEFKEVGPIFYNDEKEIHHLVDLLFADLKKLDNKEKTDGKR